MTYHLLYDVRGERLTPLGMPPTARKARARSLELEHVLTGHTGCINSIEFSDDGSLLLTGSDDTNVGLFDTLSWRRLALISTAHTRNIFNAVMVPKSGNTEILSCGLDGRVCICNLREGSEGGDAYEVATKKVVARNNAITSRIVFMEGQPRTAFVARSSGSVSVIDLRLEREISEFYPAFMDMSRSCNTIAASPVHPYILACGTDMAPVCMVDVRYARPESAAFLRIGTPMAMQSSGVGGIGFSARGDKIVCSYKSSDVFVYDWTTALDHSDRRLCDAEDIATYACHDFSSQFTTCDAKRYVGRANRLTMFKEAAFFDEDRFVVTGGDCGHVFLWDTETTRLVRKVKADSDIVNGVLTHPTAPVIIACGIDDSAKVISLAADMPASSSPQRHLFHAPRTRRRFAAESDSDEDMDNEEESDDLGANDDDYSASPERSSTSASSDSESMSLRATARAIAQCQLQLVSGDIPTRTGLVQHLRMIVRLLQSVTTSSMWIDASDEEEEEEVDAEEEEMDDEEGEEHEEAESDEASGAADESTADANDSSARVPSEPMPVHGSDESSAGEEVEHHSSTSEESDPPVLQVSQPSGDSDSDEPPVIDDGQLLGLLLFALQKYTTYLGQVRSMCASRGLIGSHEGKMRYNTVPSQGPETRQFWEVLTLFADVVYLTLDQKFVLADDEATRVTWVNAFTDVCLVKAAIAAAEGSCDRALAYLANGAAQTSWSVPLLTATVAVLHAARSSPALMEARRQELHDALQSGAGTAEQRVRARKLLRTLQAQTP
jgi:WD repeat-containing protein 42A